MLARRVHEVARSLAERDEQAARAELRALADEASLLAMTHPLIPSTLASRTAIAAERDPTGPRG